MCCLLIILYFLYDNNNNNNNNNENTHFVYSFTYFALLSKDYSNWMYCMVIKSIHFSDEKH